jgi:hypothetical protein
MELYKEILAAVLAREGARVEFPHLALSPQELVEGESYRALCRIKAVLEDDGLADPECFQKIEEIVRIFEELGSGGGTRHDFG